MKIKIKLLSRFRSEIEREKVPWPDWTAVPTRFLKKLMKKVDLADLISLAGVCRAWRSVGVNIDPLPLPGPPLLFVPSPPELPTDHYAIDLSDLTVRRFPLRWVLDDLYGVYGDHIIGVGPFEPLPPFPQCFGNPPAIHKIIFHNDVFLAIVGLSGVLLHSYARAKRWYPLHGATTASRPYADITAFRGRFFAVDETGAVEAWDIKADGSARQTGTAPRVPNEYPNERHELRFLMQCERNLMQVVRMGEPREFEEEEVGEFQLFRMFKMDPGGEEWIEDWWLDHGTAMFVSHFWAGCADVRGNPACRQDCVYGLLEEEAKGIRWMRMLEYDILSQTTEKKDLALCPFCPGPFWVPVSPAAVKDKAVALRMLGWWSV